MSEQDGTNFFYGAQIALCVGFVCLCFRFVNYFSLSRQMGPLIITILRMMGDVIKFVTILAVLIVAFGVSSSSLMYPNDWRGWRSTVNFLYRSYMLIYGELLLDEHSYDSIFQRKQYERVDSSDTRSAWATYFNPDDDAQCYKVFTKPNDQKFKDENVALQGTYLLTDYENIKRCPQGRGAADIFLGAYTLLTTVLLLNLLIALFTTTYDKANIQADQIWKFQRTELVKEYRDRPRMPPPIILLSYILSGVRMFYEKVKTSCIRLTKGDDNYFSGLGYFFAYKTLQSCFSAIFLTPH